MRLMLASIFFRGVGYLLLFMLYVLLPTSFGWERVRGGLMEQTEQQENSFIGGMCIDCGRITNRFMYLCPDHMPEIRAVFSGEEN